MTGGFSSGKSTTAAPSAPPSPALLDQRVEGEAAVGVARKAERHPRRDLVLSLNGLALRSGHIGGKRDEQVRRDALLHSDVCALRGGAAHHRADGELRNAGGFRHAAGDLA